MLNQQAVSPQKGKVCSTKIYGGKEDRAECASRRWMPTAARQRPTPNRGAEGQHGRATDWRAMDTVASDAAFTFRRAIHGPEEETAPRQLTEGGKAASG